jgi:hypothetical protein
MNDSANPELPAFLARPQGAPVCHGFPVIDGAVASGFRLGMITDFLSEPAREGDAYVIAPDGSRAGLVWESGYGPYFEEVRAPDQGRRGGTELGVQRVTAETMAVNTASWRVMEKAGLRLVRTFHQPWPYPIDGDQFGDVEYALDKAGWQQQEAGPRGALRGVGGRAVAWVGLNAGAPLFLDAAEAPEEEGGQPGDDEHAHDHEAGRVDVEVVHEAPETMGLAEPLDSIAEMWSASNACRKPRV